MRQVHHLTSDDVRRIPWKNGRGVTDELASWPPGATFERGDFDWRVSKAAVSEPGPFSVFPGFDRILVVTDGDGLLLAHGDRAARARVRRYEPYRFSGDWPTTAELSRGAVADFNVLTRRGNVEADVQVLRLGRRSAREALVPGHAFVHVLGGPVRARVSGEEEPFAIRLGESLWVCDAEAFDEMDFSGEDDEAVVVLVRLGLASSEEA